MRTKFSKSLTAYALFLCAIVLFLTACKKETVADKTNQNQPQQTSNAQAKGTTSLTSSEKINIDFSLFVPCANGGAGEDVEISGILHALTTFTINGNNVRGKTHFNPQGITGVGLATGDKYQATGVTQDQFKGSMVNGQYEESFVNNFSIIGPGSGNNYVLHENFHVTINAGGIVTTTIDNVKSDCK